MCGIAVARTGVLHGAMRLLATHKTPTEEINENLDPDWLIRCSIAIQVLQGMLQCAMMKKYKYCAKKMGCTLSNVVEQSVINLQNVYDADLSNPSRQTIWGKKEWQTKGAWPHRGTVAGRM